VSKLSKKVFIKQKNTVKEWKTNIQFIKEGTGTKSFSDFSKK